KFIPGVGSVVGGIISGTTASVVTRALADSYIQVLKVMATNELGGKSTSTDKLVDLMQKQFKKYIKENKNELEKGSSELETQKEGPLAKFAVIKRTFENFTDRLKNR